MSNIGAREQWDLCPAWHGLVYGKGKPGTGRESIVPQGVHAWPISPRQAETKKPIRRS